ncbi:MAG: MG2 domain-containing protein, partial [Prevotella sp.]
MNIKTTPDTLLVSPIGLSVNSKHSVWRKTMLAVAMLVLHVATAGADALDNLASAMRNNPQIQEKVYVQTDNTCYFVGDTLWYKAFVLRADDHRPTDMSKILYVELLSPDGVLVERQRVIVSPKGMTCGQFALPDSLYSGYYEIRAYTRWMLNFNVSQKNYTRDDKHKFYSNQMAKDYFRDWEGLYSRVLPVFSKPATAGDYDGKYMYGRPKQEMEYVEKPRLEVRFYPEGGNLVEGKTCRMAFEVTDRDGQALSLKGKLSDGTPLTAGYLGRGIVTFVPNGQKASFEWNGKTWDFDLPKAQPTGVAMQYNDGKVTWENVGVQVAAVAVTCRGRLGYFERTSQNEAVIPADSLSSGVNELLLLDSEARILASRLFFADRGDAVQTISVTSDKLDYMPFEPINISVTGAQPHMPLALSVRDRRTDDTSYDDGNMFTELLLCSDLRGFIPSPAYYFSSSEPSRKHDLDLLLMVQGWRRYERVPMLRYTPEHTLTYEGTVNKMLGVDILDINDIEGLDSHESVADESIRRAQDAVTEGGVDMTGQSVETSGDDTNAKAVDEAAKAESEVADDDAALQTEPTYLGVNHGNLKKEVLVEAELVKDGVTCGSVQKTSDGGHFVFELPPFYGKAVLFVKAYNEKDSLKKSMAVGNDKDRLNEDAYPDFYVKQDLFYPVFPHPYSWYQTHQPEWRNMMIDDSMDMAEGSKLDGDHTLSTVKVDAKRRSRRAVDFRKPAFVIDAYELYNIATDRGLSWGLPNMGTFPSVACFTVYANMNRYRDYNIRALLDNSYVFYQNFSSHISTVKNRSNAAVFRDLHLRRILNFRFYTDFEPRNADAWHTESLNLEDVTLVYELLPDDGTRYTYRDRRYLFDGFARPQAFYSPNYSNAKPQQGQDYRRTLYWNPNAMPDDDGNLNVTLYNNGKETRVRVNAEGITSDGKVML